MENFESNFSPEPEEEKSPESTPDPEEQALWAEIAEEPDDDIPRLVYADWLEDRGDPRAEFIRIQIEKYNLERQEGGMSKGEGRLYRELRGREREMLSEYGEAWTKRFVDLGLEKNRVKFERGLPTRVEISSLDDIKDLPQEVFDSKQGVPIRGVSLNHYIEGRENLENTYADPRLEGLELQISEWVILNDETTAEGLNLPEGLQKVRLNGLTTAEGLNLPEGLQKVRLNGLTTTEGLNLPEGLELVSLDGLTTAEGLNLPEGLQKVRLNGLTTAEGLNLPEGLEWVILDGLTTAEGLNLPEGLEWVRLNGLTTAEGINLPEGLEWVSLNGLTTAEGLNLPEGLEWVGLDGLTTAERDEIRDRHPNLKVYPTD